MVMTNMYTPQIDFLWKGYKTNPAAFDMNGNGNGNILSHLSLSLWCQEKIWGAGFMIRAAAVFVISFLSHLPFHSTYFFAPAKMT